jgi:hypothetical protein
MESKLTTAESEWTFLLLKEHILPHLEFTWGNQPWMESRDVVGMIIVATAVRRPHITVADVIHAPVRTVHVGIEGKRRRMPRRGCFGCENIQNILNPFWVIKVNKTKIMDSLAYQITILKLVYIYS